MPYKSHSLNLWNTTGTTKLDIDVDDSKVNFTTTGGQKIKFNQVVEVGSIADVAQKFTDVDSAIAAGNAGSAAASALVQQNLDAYETSNNATVATLSATVTSNKATTDAQHASDASARATLQTSLETKISDEETRATTAEATLTANLAQEITDRASAITTEQTARATAVSSLTTLINTEKGRIDGILSGTTIDLNSLQEIVSLYQSQGGDILGITTNLQSQLTTLTQRIDELTGESVVPNYIVRPIESVISELNESGTPIFLTDKDFSLVYDFTDRYDFSTSSMVGWSIVKAELIAGSSGVLTGSSTDEQVLAYYDSVLQSVYGSKYSGTPSEAKLEYHDSEHYVLEIHSTPAKPYFQGSEVATSPDYDWSISYCSSAGDISTKYSTILGGSKSGKSLVVVPQVGGQGIETPVSGLSGVRVGYKSSTDSLIVQ